MAEHTVKSFENEISQLRGPDRGDGRAGRSRHPRRDRRAGPARRGRRAIRSCGNDARIDALEAEVDRLAVRIIALRAPMADDLREVIAALKISGVIERIGDYAKNIAKRVT
jgi:phosphate transport system protein